MNQRSLACSALASTALFALASHALAQTADPNPTLTTTRYTGASSNRVDIVFIGDGYTASQDAIYNGHVAETVDYMFNSRLNDPLPRYQNFFNVHQVRVVSQESGADDPLSNVYVDTALRASYNTGGTDRCLYFDSFLADVAVTVATLGTDIDVDMRLGTVNSSKYGGCGGSWAVWSAGNANARDIAVHELGHSFAGLQDEYFYDGSTYTGGENPNWVNISTDPNNKWNAWLGYDDPFHDGTNGTPDMSPVGAYEGGGYYDFGLYRPTDNSMMRTLGWAMNAISREETILDIYREVDPLDGYTDNSQTLINPMSLEVDRVDDDVISLDWFIDGMLVEENGDESFDLAGLAPGDYEISVLAFDSLLDFSFTGLDYDWVRRDMDLLQQTVTWNISLVPEPGSLALLAIAPLLLTRRR